MQYLQTFQNFQGAGDPQHVSDIPEKYQQNIYLLGCLDTSLYLIFLLRNVPCFPVSIIPMKNISILYDITSTSGSLSQQKIFSMDGLASAIQFQIKKNRKNRTVIS